MAGLVSKLAGGGGQEEEREAELQSRWEIDHQPDPTCKSNSKLSDHLPASAKLVDISPGSLSLLAVIRLKYFGMFEKAKKRSATAPDDCRHSELTRKQVFPAP